MRSAGLAKRGAQGFAKRDDVIEYQRDFKAFADELIAKKVTSEGEMSRLFMRGLDEQLRSQVKLRLRDSVPVAPSGDAIHGEAVGRHLALYVR